MGLIWPDDGSHLYAVADEFGRKLDNGLAYVGGAARRTRGRVASWMNGGEQAVDQPPPPVEDDPEYRAPWDLGFWQQADMDAAARDADQDSFFDFLGGMGPRDNGTLHIHHQGGYITPDSFDRWFSGAPQAPADQDWPGRLL